MRGIGEVISHGGGKLPGAAGIPCIHAEGGTMVKTATIRNYQKTLFLSESRRGQQVDG